MKIAVQSKAGDCSFDCNEGETLLYAGLRQGITLPYECATGTCGSCRARVVKGETDLRWADAPALAKLKRDKGDILMCQTRPRTDCDIRIAANVAAEPWKINIPSHRTGTVKNLRQLTNDVIHFELALSSPMSFKAGQFVVIESKDVPGPRAYSMVNHEAETTTIALVVKRKPGGGFSNWLFDRDAEGEELQVFGALGQATFRADEGRNLICIAGGSGIAGMMSILACATNQDYFRAHKGYVFFGVRTAADAFYVEQLSNYVNAANGSLEVTLAYSHEDVAADIHHAFPALKVASGMVHEVASKSMTGRYDEMIGYVAGPAPMVDGAIRMLIAEAGLSSQWIRYDKFS
jgi:toluene monooxygenase electron transfer component